MTVTFALYVNGYSYELISDMLADSEAQEAVLINIGAAGARTSPLCSPLGDSLREQVRRLRIWMSQLNELDREGEKIDFYLPCNNHIYCGFVLGWVKHKPQHRVTYIAEGAKNYTHRQLEFRDCFRRIAKKTILSLFFLPFRLTFKDNLDGLDQGAIICRTAENIVTNMTSKIEVPRSGAPKKFGCFSNQVFVVGSHIFTTASASARKKLQMEFDQLSLNLRGVPVYYFPHPRAQSPEIEAREIYGLPEDCVRSGSDSLLESVLSENPAHIYCLGGSTLFMELKEYGYVGATTAWGFDVLVSDGNQEAKRLKQLYYPL